VETANPSAYRRLRAAIREFRPQVVHANIFLTQLSPLVLPLLREVPSIYHVCWYRAVCPRGTKLLPDTTECRVRAGRACRRSGCLTRRAWVLAETQRALLRSWFDVFDRVLAISERVQERLELDGLRVDGVLGVAVEPRGPRPPLTDPPTAVYAGRLVPEKGVDVLLRAFARTRGLVPGARLVVAGDGPERTRVEQLARELGLDGSLTLTGYLPQPELERRLDAGWVQALPSLWSEPLGAVVDEALMRGTAVVASSSAGAAAAVAESGAGVLVAAGDEIALADALTGLLGDRERAEALGALGRRYALERAPAGRGVDEAVAVYEQLV
jgi:glycosyltransferase involved in cell wall biosynthesis